MDKFWEKGELFIRELRLEYPDPKPNINTLATQVRLLETKGFLGHKSYGPTFQYYPTVSREDYSKSSLTGIVGKLFGYSYTNAVSTLIEDEKITIDELREIIRKYDAASDI